MIAHLDVPRFAGRSLCAETDPELFYPDKGGSTKPAKKLCGSCDVQAECLSWAMDRGERYGVWGGLSERERRSLATHRRRLPINHGTESGYKVHRRRGETPCAACLEANREKSRRYAGARTGAA